MCIELDKSEFTELVEEVYKLSLTLRTREGFLHLFIAGTASSKLTLFRVFHFLCAAPTSFFEGKPSNSREETLCWHILVFGYVWSFSHCGLSLFFCFLCWVCLCFIVYRLKARQMFVKIHHKGQSLCCLSLEESVVCDLVYGFSFPNLFSSLWGFSTSSDPDPFLN